MVVRASSGDDGRRVDVLLTVVHRLERLRLGFHLFPSKNSQKPGLLAVIRLQDSKGRYRRARVVKVADVGR